MPVWVRSWEASTTFSNIIPDSFVNAFAKGEILQVLLLAILVGLALVSLDKDRTLTRLADSVSHVAFKVIAFIMELAPIGAFGAMAFTIGRYGLGTLLSLGKLMLCVYLTSILFVFVVLGLIAFCHGFSLWKFLRYIREELLIVLGTSSSESVLPRMIVKMERLGCSKSIVGLVIPSGYSFNLDGTSIYLTIAALFIAQATNTHLTFRQEVFVLIVLMLNSKGAAAVTGGGFITLAATLSALGTIPVAGISLLLGVDRFMSEMRSLTNLVGNGVATIVVAKWEGEFDSAVARRMLDGEGWTDNEAEAIVSGARPTQTLPDLAAMMTNRHPSVVEAVLILLTASAVTRAQTTEPQQELRGSIRIVGTDTMKELMDRWIAGFTAVHPGVRIELAAKGALTAAPALSDRLSRPRDARP